MNRCSNCDIPVCEDDKLCGPCERNLQEQLDTLLAWHDVGVRTQPQEIAWLKGMLDP